jgi:HlyD family secretion protein
LEQQDLSKLRIERSTQPALRRRRKRPLLYAAIALAVLLVAVFGYARMNATPTVETTTVVTAYPSQALTVLNATGYVVAQRKAAVASKATGRLEWLGVAEGSHVKENEVIARLESKDVGATQEQAAANVKVAQANLEQGQAELREAQAAFLRSKELLAKKFIAAANHDAAVGRYSKAKANISSLKAAVVASEANLKAAQVGVEQTVIRAPFDGVVLTKAANIGDIVTPFSQAADSKGAVLTMADMSTLEVEADVAESSLSKIKVGQPCEIQLDALPDVRFAGVVDRTVPTVDRTKATLLVKIRFRELDRRVLPDMSAKVAFLEKELSEKEKKPLAAVNAGAVVTRDGKSVVFVLKDDKAVATSVQKGETLGEVIAVQGVAAGTKVVLRPPENLKDGAQIKLAQK